MNVSAPAGRSGRPSTASLVVQCGVFLSFGAPLAMFGAAWPDARDRFGQSSSALGVLVAAYGIGRFSTSATALRILSITNIRVATATLCVMLAIADGVAALTGNFAILVGAIGGVGLISGAFDSLGSRYQTAVRHVGSAGLMFGAYGVGATLGPAVISFTNWTAGFLTAAAISVVVGALATRRSVRWPDELDPRPHDPTAPSVSTADRVGAGASGSGTSAPLVPVAISLVLFGLVVGIEATSGNWAATYLEEGRGASATAAGLAVSGFWAGVTLGRLVLGQLRWAPRRIVLVGASATLAMLLAVMFGPVGMALVAFSATGLAVSGVFPTLVSTTVDRVGRSAAPRVSGWQLLAANIGATVLSAAVGLLVSAHGATMTIYALTSMAVLVIPLLALATRPPSALAATELAATE